ncbi:glutathione S-transferase [Ceratobasidium sp. AG-Ba]|nr:glutathione S-transferase [Ceratobasidium sp. AG-Ba]QRW10705.1 glutathione S-transferase [Ceratobasidium sp. AG-Ba]
MPPRFQLLYSPQSPYVRKVVIAARVLGLNNAIERVPTKTGEAPPPPDLIAVNPLGKIPALVVLPESGADSKQVVFDSSIILQYLDTVAEKKDTLYPPSSSPDRIKALNYEALADGVMDAAWLFRAESIRPESLRSEQWINAQNNKIRRGVEALAKLPLPEFPSAQAVVLACTLWYMSRRVPQLNWQEFENGKLAEWYTRAIQHPAWAEEGEVPPS